MDRNALRKRKHSREQLLLLALVALGTVIAIVLLRNLGPSSAMKESAAFRKKAAPSPRSAPESLDPPDSSSAARADSYTPPVVPLGKPLPVPEPKIPNQEIVKRSGMTSAAIGRPKNPQLPGLPESSTEVPDIKALKRNHPLGPPPESKIDQPERISQP